VPQVERVLAVGTIASIDQPTLTRGATFVLRPWARIDAEQVVSAFEDAAIRHWNVEPTRTRGEAIEWIEGWAARWNAETDASLAVTDGAGGIFGYAALRRLDFEEGEAEAAYWVVPGARGRGIATRAVAVVREWAFDAVGFHRLRLQHSVGNDGSCRVANNSGFAFEGVMRRSLLHDDGWHDMHLHGLVNPADGTRSGGT
jgi:RimJ/RimL family protein N-acetyltransferase